MKKALYAFLGVLVLVIGAGALVPFLVDLNEYKELIGAKVEEATGRRLAIDGEIKLSVLPLPTVSVNGARFANAPGATVPDMARLESLEVRVAVLPLLRGAIQVAKVTLVSPVIELERFTDGSANWTLALEGDEAPSAGGPGFDLSLDDVVIENGRLTYREPDLVETVEDIDVRASAEALDGPFEAEGALVARGIPLSFAISAGRLGTETTPFDFEVGTGNFTVRLSGAAQTAGEAPTVKAKLTVTGDSLAETLAGLGVVEHPLLDHKIEISADVDAAPTGAQVEALNFALGPIQGGGSVAVDLGEVPRVDAVLALKAIALAEILEQLPAPAAATGESAEEFPGEAAFFALPGGFAANLDLSLDGVEINGEAAREIRLVAGLEDGFLDLQQVSARLPGGADVSVVGFVEAAENAPRFTGQVGFSAANARATLAWLGLGLEQVPQDRLRAVQLTADVDATPALARLSGLDLRFDSSQISGTANVALGPRMGIDAELTLDQINLDAYLPDPGDSENEVPDDEAADLSVLKTFDANISARIENAVYRGTAISAVTLEAELRDGGVTLRHLGVGDLAGLRATANGRADPAQGSGELTYELEADELGGIFRFAGIEPPLPPAALRAFRSRGKLGGDPTAVRFDGVVALAGLESEVKGTLSDWNSNPRVEATLDARAPRLATLLQTFSPQTSIPAGIGDGPVTLSADVAGSLDGARISAALSFAEIESKLDGRWDGALLNPTVDFSLAAQAPSYVRLGRAFAPGSALATAARDGPMALDATVKGGLATADLSLSLSLAGADVDVSGNVNTLLRAPGYALTITAQHPDFASLLETFAGAGAAGGRALGELRLAANLSGDQVSAKLTDLDATVGPTRIGGTVASHFDGPRPSVDVNLAAGEIPLEVFLGPASGGGGGSAAPTDGPQATPGGGTKERWSRETIDLSALSAVDGKIKVTATAASFEGIRLENVVLNASLANGTLDVERFSGRLNGGEVALKGRVLSVPDPNADLEISVDSVAIGPLIPKIADLVTIEGLADLTGNFQTRGRSEFDLVSNLAGQAALNVRDGIIHGVDLPQINQQLGGLDSELSYLQLLGSATSGGQTRFTSLGGNFTAAGGTISSNDLRAALDGAEAEATLKADLPRWLIAATSEARLLGHSDAPSIGVSVNGSIDEPRTTFETNALQRHIGQNFLKGIIKKNVDTDALGGGAGAVLDAILGGGGSAPAPAPETDIGTAPETDTAPPPQAAPKKPVEQLLDGFTGGGSTSGGSKSEKPLDTLLKGIFD